MGHSKRFYPFLILTVAVALLAGCARKAERTDTQVATDVQNKIYSDAAIQSRQIGVQAVNGVVTLSGDAASDTERTTAAGDAATVEGVKTVVNNLQVQEAQAAPPPRSKPVRQQPVETRSKREPKGTSTAARHHNGVRPTLE